MTTISAKMVSDLRERTGAGLMECKRALEAAGGDIEVAIDNLRKSGLKNADKRAGRKAGAGRVATVRSSDGRKAAVVMMTCETDFVPPTEDFSGLLGKLAQHAFDHRIGSATDLLASNMGGTVVSDVVKGLTAKCGENCEVPHVAFMENAKGFVGGYIHFDQKIGGFASVSTGADAAKVAEFLNKLGQHIVFARPVAVSREQIPAEVIERERKVYMESEEVLAKPADKREGIVSGKINKFYGTIALEEQPWYLDNATTVKKMLAEALGADAKIECFALFALNA
jgi:elongation factor Ts